MKSTLIVATLIAATLVSASTLPASARNNNGAFQQSSEANTSAGGVCTVWAEAYSAAVKTMNTTKDKAKRADARDNANKYLGNAWAGGCAWVDAV